MATGTRATDRGSSLNLLRSNERFFDGLSDFANAYNNTRDTFSRLKTVEVVERERLRGADDIQLAAEREVIEERLQGLRNTIAELEASEEPNAALELIRVGQEFQDACVESFVINGLSEEEIQRELAHIQLDANLNTNEALRTYAVRQINYIEHLRNRYDYDNREIYECLEDLLNIKDAPELDGLSDELKNIVYDAIYEELGIVQGEMDLSGRHPELATIYNSYRSEMEHNEDINEFGVGEERSRDDEVDNNTGDSDNDDTPEDDEIDEDIPTNDGDGDGDNDDTPEDDEIDEDIPTNDGDGDGDNDDTPEDDEIDEDIPTNDGDGDGDNDDTPEDDEIDEDIPTNDGDGDGDNDDTPEDDEIDEDIPTNDGDGDGDNDDTPEDDEIDEDIPTNDGDGDNDDTPEDDEPEDEIDDDLTPEDFGPTRVRPNANAKWRTVLSIAAGIGIGAGVWFAFGGIGVAVLSIGGALAKIALSRRMRKIQEMRMENPEYAVHRAEDYPKTLKGQLQRFRSYMRSPEGLDAVQKMLTASIFTSLGFNILGPLLGLQGGQVITALSNAGNTAVVGGQTAANQAITNSEAAAHTTPSVPSTPTGGDLRIGDSAGNLTSGYTDSYAAQAGTGSVSLNQSLINGDSSHIGSFLVRKGSESINITDTTLTASEIASQHGVSLNDVIPRVVQNGTNLDQAWSTLSDVAKAQGGRTL